MAWYIFKGTTYIPGYGATASWTKIKNIYRKTTPANYSGTAATNFTDVSKEWRRQAGLYRKTSTGWRRVFTKTSTGVVFTTGPAIHIYSSPYPYGPNDGISLAGPRYINEVLYGKDGIWTPRNETSISRSFQAAATPDGANRFTIDGNDIFDLSSSTANQEQADESYLYYKISVQNYGDLVTASAGPVKLIKREASFNSQNLTGTTTVGSTLTGTYSLENRWYNKPELYNSYIRWWRSSTTDPTGTLVREEYLGDHYSTNNSTTLSGSDSYTIQAADAGYYIIFQVVPYNSYNRHYGYETYMSYPSNIISAPITISGVNFTDSNGRSGKNARGNLVTNTATNLNWTVNGVNANTTFRVRYRVLNNQTGLYYKPDTPGTSVAAGSAWLSFTDDYYGSGNISSVSISGSTATLYDAFTIDTTFNGSTYGGGISRWTFQYEISVVNASGTRYYWNYGDSISTTQANDYWDIDPTTNPSISASPATIAPGGTVTFSGTFNPYPAALSSYPHSYRIVYGDGANSGWITLGSSPANQTYSQSHTYSSAGSYSAYVEVTPTFTTNYAYVTASSVLTPPTITNVTAGNSNGQPVTVYFTGGSGPYYQIWWTTGVGGTGYDEYGYSSPITDNTGPTSASTAWYAYVRSVSSLTNVGTGPSTTISNWSTGYQFTVTQAPITPTITMNANTSVGNAGATINWSSTNQSYAYVDGTYVGNVNTYTFSGLSSSTYYSGTVTVYSTTGTTASASYSFTTTANITYGPCTPYGSPYYTNSSYDCYGDYSYAWTDNYYYQRKEILSNGVWNGSYDYSCANTSVRTYGSFSQVNGQCGYSPPAVTPAITSGPFISWASGNNFTLSASASNATNLEFQVQFANSSGGTVQSTQTFFFGASSGGGTTGSQSYPWARTRVRANNSSTGLSSAFTGYSGWA